jgi:hypothetical protein
VPGDLHFDALNSSTLLGGKPPGQVSGFFIESRAIQLEVVESERHKTSLEPNLAAY